MHLRRRHSNELRRYVHDHHSPSYRSFLSLNVYQCYSSEEYIGASLIMTIIYLQLKLEKFFEEILLSVIEEYSSNPEARALRGDKIGKIFE